MSRVLGLTIGLVMLVVGVGAFADHAEARAKKPGAAQHTCECHCESWETVRLSSGFVIPKYSQWVSFATAGLCVAYNEQNCQAYGHNGMASSCDDRSDASAARSAPGGVSPTLKGE